MSPAAAETRSSSWRSTTGGGRGPPANATTPPPRRIREELDPWSITVVASRSPRRSCRSPLDAIDCACRPVLPNCQFPRSFRLASNDQANPSLAKESVRRRARIVEARLGAGRSRRPPSARIGESRHHRSWTIRPTTRRARDCRTSCCSAATTCLRKRHFAAAAIVLERALAGGAGEGVDPRSPGSGLLQLRPASDVVGEGDVREGHRRRSVGSLRARSPSASLKRSAGRRKPDRPDDDIVAVSPSVAAHADARGASSTPPEEGWSVSRAEASGASSDEPGCGA